MVFIFARPCEALLHISMRVISMSAHVSYETPNDVADKIYEMVSANKNGKMKKGSNEVTRPLNAVLHSSSLWQRMSTRQNYWLTFL